MKQPTFHGRVLLPLSVYEAARAGDILAMGQILRYYDSYINKLCTRTLYDKDGLPHVQVDEYMKHHLQNKPPCLSLISTTINETSQPIIS